MQTLERARRRGNALLALGWLLTLINLGSIVWAVALPIILQLMPQDVFFTLEDGSRFALWGTVSIAFLAALAIAQLAFADKISHRMREDIPETVAAEAALRIAKYTAGVALVLLLVSLLPDIKTYRAWTDYSRL